jgi:hypothetical protein
MQTEWRVGFWGASGIGATAVLASPTLAPELAVGVFLGGCLLILVAAIILAMATKRRRRPPNVPKVGYANPTIAKPPAQLDLPRTTAPRAGRTAIRIVGGKNITLRGNRSVGFDTLIDAENVEDLTAEDNLAD